MCKVKFNNTYMYLYALVGCTSYDLSLLQVFPDKAQYPDDKEWENEWDDGEAMLLYTITTYCILVDMQFFPSLL